MNLMKIEQSNFNSSLGVFISAIRQYIFVKMEEVYGDSWERKYFEVLNEVQQEFWSRNRHEVEHIYELIDFANLSTFSKRSKFFDKLVKNGWLYYTSFIQINEARNKSAHFAAYDKDVYDLAYAQMISISKGLELNDTVRELKELKNNVVQNESTINHTKKTIENLSNLKQRPKIKKVIDYIFNETKVAVDKKNSNLSTINKNGIYSVEPNLNRIENDWFLILIDTDKTIMYLFKVPANHKIYEKLYKREDKNVYRLLFDIGESTFTDKLSGEKFNIFLSKTIKYDFDTAIF